MPPSMSAVAQRGVAIELPTVGPVAEPKRSVAVDALRGIAIIAMVFVDLPGRFAHSPVQLQHSSWAGLRVADFVFPCFLVAAGAALGLTNRQAPVRTLVWRSIRLFAIGVALVAIKNDTIAFESGTLQLIAVVWFIGALDMRLDATKRLVLCGALLSGSVLVHVGGWTQNGPELWIDSKVFGERSDLGVLCMIWASVAVILASVVAQRTKTMATFDKVRILLTYAAVIGSVGGLAAIAGAPIVKRLWTPSYVLITVAGSFVMWAVLEAALAEPRRWANPLVALGRNALVIYVAMSLVGSLVPEHWTDAFTDVVARRTGEVWASLLYSAVVVLILTIAAEVLRRRRLMIRI